MSNECCLYEQVVGMQLANDFRLQVFRCELQVQVTLAAAFFRCHCSQPESVQKGTHLMDCHPEKYLYPEPETVYGHKTHRISVKIRRHHDRISPDWMPCQYK